MEMIDSKRLITSATNVSKFTKFTTRPPLFALLGWRFAIGNADRGIIVFGITAAAQQKPGM
jgi:hypothetical protein